MATKVGEWFQKHEKLALTLLVFLFVLIRLPGLSQPLHQDEYKWPLIVNPANASSSVQIPHPPLSEFIYRFAGEVVGFNVHFRVVPLVFSVANLLLLYVLLKRLFDKNIAFVGATFFTLSYFSILASLMVDTDGAIMPFFFLIMFIAYNKVKNGTERMPLWILVGLLSALAGLFIKVSFVLGILALAGDFLWERRGFMKKKDILRYGIYGGCFIVGFILLLVISQKLFPFFNLGQSVTYWEHFASSHRDWFQTCIQVAKAILYTSPFLILVPFFLLFSLPFSLPFSQSIVSQTPSLPSSRRDFDMIRPFIFFLAFGFIFYILLFDFSLGALDRYLQFVIIPLCAISAVVVERILGASEIIETSSKNRSLSLGVGIILSIALSLLNFLPHAVPSLHPKSAWIGRILSLHWNFLYPFSGGSGPMGFYISFLFISLSWIISLTLVALVFFKKSFRPYALLILIPLGLTYNLMFTEEYLFGNINGSAPKLLSHVVEFIKNDPDIQHVTVYNDNGGQEIQDIGKYRKRLYTDPKFDLTQKISTLNQYKEHYLEINIPRIDPTSVYRSYLDSCRIIYSETDQAISAKVYDCRGAGDVNI